MHLPDPGKKLILILLAAPCAAHACHVHTESSGDNPVRVSIRAAVNGYGRDLHLLCSDKEQFVKIASPISPIACGEPSDDWFSKQCADAVQDGWRSRRRGVGLPRHRRGVGTAVLSCERSARKLVVGNTQRRTRTNPTVGALAGRLAVQADHRPASSRAFPAAVTGLGPSTVSQVITNTWSITSWVSSSLSRFLSLCPALRRVGERIDLR